MTYILQNLLILCFYVLCLVAQSCLTLCDPMDCSLPGSSVHGDFPGKNTRVDCHALLQGIFPTQGLNPGVPHCRPILCCLSHQGNPLFLSVQLSPSVVSDSVTPWIAACQAPLSITTPGVYSNSCPSSQWCHPAISSSVIPSPMPNPSQHQGLSQWVNSSHEVATVLEFQLQHQSFQWTPRTDLL